MKIKKAIPKLFRMFCFFTGAVVLIYAIAYPMLRISRVLVRRSYLVYHYNSFGDQTTVEHMDIGRGAAYGPHGEHRFHAQGAKVFAPLSWIERHIRGFGEYPETWPGPKVGMNEEMSRIRKTLETAQRPQVTDDPVPKEVYKRWQERSSYYAFVEIIDAHLANRPEDDRATKQEVFKLLGKPNSGTFNQDPVREWAYQGLGRHVPNQDKAIFMFDDKDELIDIGWVSE